MYTPAWVLQYCHYNVPIHCITVGVNVIIITIHVVFVRYFNVLCLLGSSHAKHYHIDLCKFHFLLV